jgi:LacI family transcriptional regulator
MPGENGDGSATDRGSDAPRLHLDPTSLGIARGTGYTTDVARKRLTTSSRSGNGKTLNRVSHQDIAREAGVSRVTVSLILAGKDQTSEQTRQRVLEVATRLKYRPNLLVHGMQSGRTHCVGVIMPASMHFHGQVARGIHDELVAADHVPIQLWINLRKHDKSTELNQIHRLIDRRVDGMIIFPVDESVPDVHFREIWQRDVPLVTVDRETTTHADHVGTDEERGALLAAEHLLGLEHRRVAHVTFPKTVGSNLHRRATTFARRMEEEGGTCEVIRAQAEELTSLVARLLEQKPRPTAIFAATDPMAMKVYSAAAAMGVNIPQALSVVGYADFPFAGDMVPPLTTVRQDPYEMGRLAAEMLLDRLLGRVKSDAPRRLRMAPELVVRGSTSSPAVAES